MLKTIPSTFTLAAWAALALSACGGGSSGSSTPETTSLAITGTAATGAAIAAGTVQVKCASGTGTATTLADGTYSATVPNGSLPCAVRVTSGTTVLHSVVTQPSASGAPLVANITPLTELLVANVAGGDPSALFDTFDATAQARVTPTAVTSAISTTLLSLQGTVDLTGVDPLSGTLVAANGSTAGNAQDALLDQLRDALQSSGATLATLRTAVATATPTTAAAAPPALAQVATAATTCAALRSGTYRVINPHETTHDVGYATYRLSLDAATLTLTDIEPSHQPAAPLQPDRATLTPVAGAPCSFTLPGDFGTQTALVAPGGVIVVRSPSSSDAATGRTSLTRTSLLVPEGSYALSQLAGEWNYIGYIRDGALLPTVYNDQQLAYTGTLNALFGKVNLNASGGFSALTECIATTCSEQPSTEAPQTLTPHPLGGFSSGSDRVFAFKTAGGAMAMFLLRPNEGGLAVFVRQSPLNLPAVGAVSEFREFEVGNGSFSWAPLSNGATALAERQLTVTATDVATQSFTRLRASDSRVDTQVVNSPYPGLRYRAAVVATGGQSAQAAAVTMPLATGGLSFYASATTANNFFGISVTKPAVAP